MKRYSILIIVMLFFSTSGLFAVELWNGFTTEMTEEDVIIRAREVLKMNNPNEGSFPSGPFRRTGDKYNLNFAFPEGKWLSYSDDKSTFGGLRYTFYFRNERLFHVRVQGDLHPNDFYPLIVNQYGQPLRRINELDRRNLNAPPGQQWDWYVWETDGKIIYSFRNDHDSSDNGSRYRMYIYSKQALDDFKKEQADAEVRRRAEEDRLRKEKESKVIF